MSRRGKHSKGRHLREATGSTRVRVAYSVLLSALVALALVVVALPMATEGKWRTIQTGSMEPVVSPGDVVLVSPADTVNVGDIIAFPDPLRPERDVLHRVVDIGSDGRLVTKGDANDVADPWLVEPGQVIGTQAMSIPAIGRLVEVVSTDLGVFVFLFLPATLILISESRVWYRFIRYGSEAFDESSGGRHLPPRGKHLAGAH